MTPSTLSSSNVVPLLPASAHWPAGLQDAWLRLHTALGQAWESWAQAADDALFKRSEGAVKGEDVQRFFEAMRLLRKRRAGIERDFWTALRQGVEAALVTGSSGPRRRPEEATLSLVENGDLEQGLAIHAMAERWRHAASEQWDALAARWEHFTAPRKLAAPHDLPVGPESLAAAFRLALDGEEAFDLPVRLVLTKLFERQTEEPLLAALVNINQTLASQGVLPHWTARPPRPSRAASAEPSRVEVQPTAGPGWKTSASPALDVLLIETLAQLRPWIAAQQRAVLEGAPGIDPEQLGAALLERLPQTARRQDHREAIDLVARVFGFLLKDNSMPAAVQVLLGRLQLPYLRLAVLDPQGFAKIDHPARQLLDVLASEGQKWTEAEDPRNARFEALQATVQRLLESGDEDLGVFAHEHQQWQQRQQQDQARHQRREMLAVQTQEGQERKQMAQRAAAKILTDRLAGVALPPDIHALLAHHWGAVLVLLWLRHGPESGEYRRAAFVLDQVRYAARYSPASCASPNIRLIEGAPEQIRQGLALTGLSAEALDSVVARIQSYLSQRLGLPASPAPQVETCALPAVSFTPPPSSPTSAPATSVVAPVQPVPTLSPEEASLLAPIHVGTWLEFQHQEQQHRAKLSWISPFSGRWLLVSAKGLKVADLSPEVIAQQLMSGQASVLPEQPLLQRALAPVQAQ